jgi:hypothetical protein
MLEEDEFDIGFGIPNVTACRLDHTNSLMRNKRVQFCSLLSTSTAVIARHETIVEEVNDTWWSPHEYFQLKHCAIQITSNTREEMQSFIAATLDQPFDNAQSIAFTCEDDVIQVLENEDESAVVGDSDDNEGRQIGDRRQINAEGIGGRH